MSRQAESVSSPWHALLRIVIGWHFLYEGFAKLISPGWSAAAYLNGSTGPFAGFFHSLASFPLVDALNIAGLVLIGLGLVAGVAIRAAAWSGIVLLALYYLAYPPFFSVVSGIAEGQYLIVNKNLVELFALVVVAAFPAERIGLGALISARRRKPEQEAPPAALDRALPSYLGPMSRRNAAVALAGLPVLGAFVLAVLKKHGWKSIEEVQLRGRDVTIASATVKSFGFSTVRELRGHLPTARIGNVTLSRMILGGNLIGGWAHARDLIYASKLVTAYHHRGKIFETLDLAESCGVNTILTNPLLCNVINDYWRAGGKIQFISDCGGKDLLTLIQQSIDRGACACYIQGGVGDLLVSQGKYDLIAKALELIRRNGLPAGIGGHKLATIRGCVDHGLRPDFWMKTLHQVNYWSAQVQPENDNTWCDDPLATIAFMKNLAEPWIAFKILAAGAIQPEAGFRYAFANGADFICVGMYDFQVVEDVNIAVDVLRDLSGREREWRA